MMKIMSLKQKTMKNRFLKEFLKKYINHRPAFAGLFLSSFCKLVFNIFVTNKWIMTEFFTSLFEDFTLAGIIFNLFCSLLASFIFIILLLYLLKPHIKIVEKIAFKNIKIDGDEGKDAYLFKIINKSFFPLMK